jgi:hypothetical protein
MSGETHFVGSALPRPSLRTALAAPVRLQTYRNLLYLALAFPLGLCYFVVLSVGLSLGGALVVTVVGIPLLLVVLAVATGLASVERRLTALLLGVSISSPTRPADGSLVDRAKRLVVDVGTWKAVVYLGSKLFIGVTALVLITSLLVTAVTMLFVPFVYDRPGVFVGVATDGPATLHPSLFLGWNDLLVGAQAVFTFTSWRVTSLPEATGVAALGVLLGVVSLNLLNGLAWLSARYTEFMLGGDADRGDAGADAAV